MPESLVILLLTTLISFAGSVQPGPVNLAVVQTTLTRNFKTGIWVALSGTFPEIIYTIAALKSYAFLAKHQVIFEVLDLATIPFFLIAGFYSFYSSPESDQKRTVSTGRKEVFKGFAAGILNPQLLPFWLVVLVYLNSFFRMETFGSQLSFVLGAAMGAFLILLLFACLAHRFQEKLPGLFSRYPLNKVIGLFFISMSLFQTCKIILRMS
jgi:threonine/homoserine/homoserine lactone efflux protein